MSPPLPGPPLRIAVLGDFDGPHTRRWVRVFIERGHDVHTISFYEPRQPVEGATLHVLSGRTAPSSSESSQAGPTSVVRMGSVLPPSLQRLAQGLRYRRAGLKQTLREIEPAVFHAHYAVEHGFYGALAGFHPYVVSAWGSDIFVEPRRPLNRMIARYALRRADLVTVNDPAMALRAYSLGVARQKIRILRLGIDAIFFETPQRSVNLLPPEAEPPTVLSDRALEPVYNIDVVLRAFAKLRRRLPIARLVIAHDGSQRAHLESLARELAQGESVRFVGRLEPAELVRALAAAHVYVSVASSDSLALSTMEAMAVGAFPVVSDLASQDRMITHRVNGLRVPTGDVDALAEALFDALTDTAGRREAVRMNRERVEAAGQLEANMLRMERLYYRLAGHRLEGEGPLSTL